MKRFQGYEMGKRILQEETRMAMLEKMVGGSKSIHGGQGHRVRSESGYTIPNFATTYDMMLQNTWFKRRDSHFITFKSVTNIKGLFGYKLKTEIL